ncbi:MAG: 3-deoxy-D-manno-octulosonic acid transferase, partial [Nitrosomonadales bacterium]|nr:3-deoxy-D-manno-octulosonic acid transferase [Nitrosomonadales bacterium]MBT4759553.1 3-deoxy-D-manno-octulosonic acid transferase [Nitrosomonadales bacterium]
MRLFIYNIIVYLILPLTIIKLIYRGIKNKDYLRCWAERFAIYPRNGKSIWDKRKTLWIHCVSVGETKAIFKLLEELQKKYPQAHFLITNGTPTGKKV